MNKRDQILVVEDDQFYRDYLKELLIMRELDVIVLDDGLRACEMVATHRPDLVILHSRVREPFTPHGSQEVALAEMMQRDYQVIGDFAFSENYFNRLFVRDGVLPEDRVAKLQTDFRRIFIDVTGSPPVPKRREPLIDCRR